MNIDQIDVLEKELERLLNWIGAAESRLAFLFSLSTAMIGALAISLPEIFQLPGSIKISTIFAILLLFLAILFVVIASFPITKGPSGSLIYFGSINNLTSEEYTNLSLKQTRADYENDLRMQCHRNAQIATRKFSLIQKSMICTFASILPWALSMFNSIIN